MPSFDRYAARDYATKYALTANSDYPPFDNDCTSFVSQCMYHGGWTMLVTVAGSEIKVSFHTTNTLNKPLATIEASYPSSSGNAFLYWKILSKFTK